MSDELYAQLRTALQDTELEAAKAASRGDKATHARLTATAQKLTAAIGGLDAVLTGAADLPDAPATPNPVAMAAPLRRQMGDVAANFLDDYAFSIHEKVIDFMTDLRDVALRLDSGIDPEDGVFSLREALRDEVGRRGLAAIEPVYDQWLESLFRALTREINAMFSAPEAPVALKDSQIGRLLGLDALEPEAKAADQNENDGMEPEEAEAEALKGSADEDSSLDHLLVADISDSQHEPEVEMPVPISRDAPKPQKGNTDLVPDLNPDFVDALGPKEVAEPPLFMATAPVSARLSGKVSSKGEAQDFVPSGKRRKRLE